MIKPYRSSFTTKKAADSPNGRSAVFFYEYLQVEKERRREGEKESVKWRCLGHANLAFCG